MSLSFCPLASGSKGNAIFIKSEQATILVDLGITFSQLEKRLEEISFSPEEIDAVFISHEHRDHIDGLKSFYKIKKVPVYSNADTAKGIYEEFGFLLDFHIFTTNESFLYKDLLIHPFSIPHDTLDPVGFRIDSNKYSIGMCTDFGFVSTALKQKLQKCHVLYLEANHEVSFLLSSSRPEILKQRILGKQGHLSNEECAKLIIDLYHKDLKHVYLAHLSSECNSEEKALKVVEDLLEEKKISLLVNVAYQNEVSKYIELV